jgi:hypothetical protein
MNETYETASFCKSSIVVTFDVADLVHLYQYVCEDNKIQINNCACIMEKQYIIMFTDKPIRGTAIVR